MIDFIFRKKYFIAISLLLIAIIFLLLGLLKLENQPAKPGIIEQSVDQNDWIKYTSKDFNFTISFPSDWKIHEEFSNKEIPKINLYKEKYKIDLPLDNFSPDSNISIFPFGISNDAVMGNIKEGKIDLADQTVKALDYFLLDGKIWASYFSIETPPKSWKPWGFVWVNNEIKDLTFKCFEGNKEIDLENCNPFEGDILERDGKIDLKIRDEQIMILKTFKFIN
jgi:hypothetical protein